MRCAQIAVCNERLRGHPRVYGVDEPVIIVLLDSCRRFNSSRTRLPRLRDDVLRNARSHGMTPLAKQLPSVRVFVDVSSRRAPYSPSTMIHKLGRASSSRRTNSRWRSTYARKRREHGSRSQGVDVAEGSDNKCRRIFRS